MTAAALAGDSRGVTLRRATGRGGGRSGARWPP